MKPFLSSILVAAFATTTIVAGRLAAELSPAPPAALEAQSAHGMPAPARGAPKRAGVEGKVVETMDSGGYTYVRVDDGSKKIWAAAPKFAVAVGDQVVVPEGVPMPNFESKGLGRTFDVVYFVPSVQVKGRAGATDEVTAAHAPALEGAAPVDTSGVTKAEGGQTVAELFARKADLAGKEVTVRGKVAKYTPAVMGKNWVHVQDGTGAAGTNDLTVTTSATAAVGNTVLVRGKLVADKDFGFGYKYEILVEDASLTVE